MDEATRLKWMEYSNDFQTTHPYSKLLKFLDMQASHFESVTSEQKLQTTKSRSYAVTVKKECIVCGRGGKHPLGACSKFQGMAREEQWDMVEKGSLCKNCLNPGHIVSKCRAPPMYKSVINTIIHCCT